MFNFIYDIPNTHLFILLNIVFIVVSVVGVLILKKIVKIKVTHEDNPALGNVAGFIGMIYGVLAGLTALYLINNLSYTADAVQREANSLANIYRDSQWLKEPSKTDITNEVKNYLNTVIHVEWPYMKIGKALNRDGENIIDSMANKVNVYAHTYPSEMLIMQDMLTEVKALYNARELRIHMSFSALNSEIWIVILIGTILTIGITYLFKMKLRLHIVAVSASALMASSMIFLLLTLERPFQGEFVIEPTALQAVLSAIK